MSEPAVLMPRLADTAGDQMLADAGDRRARGKRLRLPTPCRTPSGSAPLAEAPLPPHALQSFETTSS